jgi:hypothetical protein
VKFSEDEVTTNQASQHRTTIQGPPRWYRIPLQVHYRATCKQGPLRGFGQTRLMSSKDIIFNPNDGLKPGMNAEIPIA